jgi:hypothetical protein
MRARAKPFSVLFAELALASWQTILLRTGLIVTGACPAAEFRTMVMEKMVALQESGYAAIRSGGDDHRAIMRPWHRAATANAKRLRRRRRARRVVP